MENNFQLLDIILFAGVAGFLLFRLRSVLGRRTGNERRRDTFAPRPIASGTSPFNVTPTTTAEPAPAAANGADGLAALQAADPNFTADAFLVGARTAFEMIVKAFAAGDTATLQPLLSPEVFAAFSEAIRERQAAKETHETKIVAIKVAVIEHVAIENGNGLVTVKLVTDQINATRAADGSVVEGDADKVIEKTDFWTFSRPVRSRNPNWILVATHSP
ncbi:MAG TPA: Tim44/TimA family putative adaptor protein [Stellaceae bacterium]|jgi:predicted lipid-binding transport protein (Tim44 family)|nr:Tim44/TimA family putative adaptor protein [Stellaceae bacterium]